MAQTAVIRCPACGVETEEMMPHDACVYFCEARPPGGHSLEK